jgi:SAM-dependent methyltransferase
MDLVERQADLSERHPWEQSRARALERILRKAGRPVRGILDFGCGDAYTGRMLLERLGAESLAGVDVYLTPEQCVEYSEGDGRVALHRTVDALGARRFDLALLCDVIEHVEDDVALLRTVRSRLAPDGRILVTVPAFQSLFGDQDRALKHYRRYTRPSLEASLRAADLSVLASGYLFGSLLVVRIAEKLLEVARGSRDRVDGVGRWSGGRLLTRLLSDALNVDNALLITLAEHRLKVPGLSAWALCTAS